MIMVIRLNKRNYWILPVLIVSIVALVITLTNEWPLSWDVYTHINYAMTYMNYGITTVDPYLNAPSGKTIGYAPLFHFLLIFVAFITNSSLLSAAKVFQVILPIFCVFLLSYISYKMYNEVAGLATGLLLISSFMFSRMFYPIPESVAILFFVTGIYLYYLSIVNKNIWYGLLSGLMALLILSVHFSSFIYYMILLSVMMVVEIFNEKNLDGLKSYILAIIVIGLVAILGIAAIVMISPSHISQIFSGFNSILSDPMSLFMGQKAMGLERYIKCIGYLPLIFGIIGLIYSFKNRELLFVSAWTLIAFVFSNLHWFGIPVYTFRMLLYVIMPGVIIGGYGVAKLVEYLDTKQKAIPIILIILLIILSIGSCYSAINDDSFKNTYSSTEISTYHIAPPTSDEVEVINWFESNGDKNESILTNNQFFGMIISSTDEMPMHYNFDQFTNQSSGKSSLSGLEKEKIGYIVYDKSLVLNNSSEYSELSVQKVNGSYYPTYYFTKEITNDTFEEIQLSSTTKVFENNRFIICRVDSNEE